MTDDKNQKIELTPEQTNPYLARPEDFEVSISQTSPTPGHGQRGDTAKEEARLLAKRKAQGKGVDLPTATDDAGKPHIASRPIPVAFKRQ
jgi:hypothetical protein